jgi:hypothetical protein
MQEVGRLLVFLGIAVTIAGLIVIGLARIGVPFGKLPGDIAYRGRSFSFFAPLGTSLLLSILLSLLLFLFARFRR